jgi:hypothetical protein
VVPTSPERVRRLRRRLVVALRALPAPVTISELSADNEVALELALWDSVKDDSPAELESYLEQYPDGTFASLARTRLDATALSLADPATPTLAEAAAEAS